MTSLSTFLDRPGWSFAPLSEEAVAPLLPVPWGRSPPASRRRGATMVNGGVTLADAQPASEAEARGRVEGESELRARLGMEAYARGETAAFDQVYDAIAGRVFAYLSRQTRDPVLAADLLQQTFLQMHK